MKHKGSISQTYLKRDEVILPMLLRKARNLASWPTTMQQLCCIAASLPTPFFCISDDAALDYIRKRHLHGIVKSFSTEYRQRLYEAFWDEFVAVYEKSPELGLQNCVLRALSRQAPCVGLSPHVIQLKIAHKK